MTDLANRDMADQDDDLTQADIEAAMPSIFGEAALRGATAPRAEQAQKGNFGPYPSLDLVALSGVDPEPRRFVIERIAPERQVTLFTGPGSAGKSLLGQQLATAMAAGVSCLGLEVKPGVAVYLTCEDDADELHRRQLAICAALRVDMASLDGRLHLISRVGELDNVLTTVSEKGDTLPSASFVRLSATVRSVGSSLIVLDNVAHLFDGNENDRGEVTQFVNLLNRLAQETGAAILMLAHPNKAGDDYSGSTGWNNAVRSRVFLEHDEETDLRHLRLPKSNYSKKGDVVSFRWHEWAFVRDDDLPPDTQAKIAEAIRSSSENAAFLGCLREIIRQNRQVSEMPTAANYAPKKFEGMHEAKGFKKRHLEAAMDRLFRIGAIERGFLRRDTAEGKNIFGLREVSPDNPEPPSKRGSKDDPDAPASVPETSPEASRKHIPETSGDQQNSTGNTPLYTTYTGAALEAAAPDNESDDLDWGEGAGEED